MSEYISKEEAINKLKSKYSFYYTLGRHHVSELEDDINTINKMQPADVRENVHGMWIDTAETIDYKYGRHNYICHKCHEKATYFVGGTEDWWCVDKPNFCPNCGANMITESEE